MGVTTSKAAAEREADSESRGVGLPERGLGVETFGHEDKSLKGRRLRRWVARPEIGVPKYPRKKCMQKGHLRAGST